MKSNVTVSNSGKDCCMANSVQPVSPSKMLHVWSMDSRAAIGAHYSWSPTAKRLPTAVDPTCTNPLSVLSEGLYRSSQDVFGLTTQFD